MPVSSKTCIMRSPAAILKKHPQNRQIRHTECISVFQRFLYDIKHTDTSITYLKLYFMVINVEYITDFISTY